MERDYNKEKEKSRQVYREFEENLEQLSKEISEFYMDFDKKLAIEKSQLAEYKEFISFYKQQFGRDFDKRVASSCGTMQERISFLKSKFDGIGDERIVIACDEIKRIQAVLKRAERQIKRKVQERNDLEKYMDRMRTDVNLNPGFFGAGYIGIKVPKRRYDNS